jgi:Ca2+-binding RTX toxin-like protein
MWIRNRSRSASRRAPWSNRSVRLGFESLEPRRLMAVDAVDDVVSRTVEGGTQPIDVLDNDTWDGTHHFVSVTQGSLGGFVFVHVNHQGLEELRYSPPQLVNVTETFTYTLADGSGNQDTATVSVQLGNVFILGGLAGSTNYYPGTTVPGELHTTVIAFHDPDPSVTYTAEVRWSDGVVTQAHVGKVSNANGNDGHISFWRTFTTQNPTLAGYQATGVLRSSDGTIRNFIAGADVQTIVIRPDRADPSKSALVIGGFEFGDPILFQPDVGGKKMVVPYVAEFVPNEPSARVSYHGSDMGAFIADHLIVYGQGGNDLIQVNQAITFHARLFGQAGNDTLVGGGGHDILIGGVGDDTLYGFGGRDLVFGGLGRDFVQGAGFNGTAAGDDSDIVIGSYVSFDNDLLSLSDLSKRWVTTNPYSARVSNGKTVSKWLRWDDPVAANNTVFDDWSLDYVFGASDLDWFFVEPTRDNFDRQSNETLN